MESPLQADYLQLLLLMEYIDAFHLLRVDCHSIEKHECFLLYLCVKVVFRLVDGEAIGLPLEIEQRRLHVGEDIYHFQVVLELEDHELHEILHQFSHLMLVIERQAEGCIPGGVWDLRDARHGLELMLVGPFVIDLVAVDGHDFLAVSQEVHKQINDSFFMLAYLEPMEEVLLDIFGTLLSSRKSSPRPPLNQIKSHQLPRCQQLLTNLQQVPLHQLVMTHSKSLIPRPELLHKAQALLLLQFVHVSQQITEGIISLQFSDRL